LLISSVILISGEISASWWGGQFERMVGLVKKAFSKHLHSY
jgi:hypothetical protein